jgi:hypothetical protein
VRRGLLIVLVVLLAGCGSGSKSAQTGAQTTTAPPATISSGDPGTDAVEAFVAAAAAGNTQAIWGMLSTESRQRLGPTIAEFERGAGGQLTRRVGSFRDVKVIVSERVTPEFGVVAIDGRRNGIRSVYAVPLRLAGTEWKLELGGPVEVHPIGPDPGAREAIVAQIAAAVTGPAGTGTAVMYLDGHSENPTVAGTASNATMYVNFEPALDVGRHTVVVFASDDRNVAAAAWTFTVAR